MGRPVQDLPGRQRRLPSALRALHRPQPRPRTNDHEPTAYAWSSCAALCGLRRDPLLTLHPTQQALDAADSAPGAAYRALLADALAEHDLAAIRAYLQQQRAYGRDDFQAMVEAKTRRFAGVRPAHRPAASRPLVE